MKLQRVSKFFGNVPLQGWDRVNSRWVDDVSFGNFLVYDRFISARTFGQKKRLFIAHPEQTIDLSLYELVRDPSGVTHMVESRNVDIGGVHSAEVYLHVFMLHEAVTTVDVITYTTVAAGSGYRTERAETVTRSVLGDYERYTAEQGEASGVVRFSGHVFWLPRTTTLTTDNELRVGSTYFDVKEVNPMLLLSEVRAVERGL